VRLFGRRKPLHEQLAEEGGLAAPATTHEPDPFVPPPAFRGILTNEPAISGLARQREWDAVVTAGAPDIEGTEVTFVALPDRSLLVEDEQGDAQLDPLARAVEDELAPPYRARAVRQSDAVWAVFANRIRVEEFHADGDDLEVVMNGDERSLRVDGSPSFGTVPALERVGQEEGPSYVVRATRLDGDLWEVRATPL
jgi:hypothetical protein